MTREVFAMAQHGYLREFDEGWDRGGDRDRWRDEDRERGWRRERDFGDRNRSVMFARAERFRSGGEQAANNFRGGRDDYYLSWRDKQMEALDREYAEYCAEREQEFQRDFDAWRRQRRSNPEPLQTGMTQSGLAAEPTGELQLTAADAIEPATGPDPMATATLDTPSNRGP
jgi:hypothetical protein